MANEIMITLVKSSIGSNKSQRDTLKALGLNKVGSTSTKPNNDSTQGMIKKVAHLVEVK